MKISPRVMTWLGAGLLVFVALSVPTAALAQPAGEPPATGTEIHVGSGDVTPVEHQTIEDAPPAPEMADEQQTSAPPPVEAENPHAPREDRDTAYYFLGARFRLLWIPTFMVNLFADVEDWGGAVNPAAGVEFTYRKNGFDIITSLWWAGATASPGFMKGQTDPRTSFEEIRSNMNLFFLTADFVWSYEFSDVLSFNYGAGVGIGLVTGSLVRNEAYYQGGSWHACPGPNPALGGDRLYCEDSGGTYDVDEAEGSGDVPPVVPWLSIPHLGLRIKPHRNFMMRIDLGFGLGFFMGVSGNYGI